MILCLQLPAQTNIKFNGDESMSNENKLNLVCVVKDFLNSIGNGLPDKHQILIEKYKPIVSKIINDSEENEVGILVLNKIKKL